MISTTTPLPLLTGSAPADLAPHTSPDTPRNSDAPSFQSHLDQHNDLRRAHHPSAPPHSRTVTHRHEDEDDADASHEDAAAHASAAASSKDSAVAAHDDRDEDDNKAKAKDAAHKDAQGSAPAPPFTPAALALAGGIAPLPAPASPPAAPAPPDQSAISEPVIAAPVLTAPQSAAPLAADALPAAAPLAANTPLPLLNLPGVSMDSNAAGKTAAPGVADASLQTAAPAAAPAGLSLPAALLPADTANTAAPTSASAFQTAPATFSAQNADLNNAAPLPLAVLDGGATAPVPPAVPLPHAAANDSAVQTIAPSTLPDTTVNAVVTLAVILPATVSPIPVSMTAPQNGVTAARTAVPVAGASASPTSKPSAAAAMVSVPSPTNAAVPAGATIPADNPGGNAPTNTANKEQNLGGIERLLTLGMGKAANAPASGSAVAAQVPGAATSGAAEQAGANTGVFVAQRHLHASSVLGANAGASVPPAPLPDAPTANTPGANTPGTNAQDALAASTLALSPPADAGNAPSPMTMPPGAATRMADMLQAGGKNSGIGPAPLLTPEVSTSGANVISGLPAASGAQSQSSGADSEQEQAQSGAQNPSGDSAAGDTSGSGLSGVVNAPTTSTQITTAAGAAVSGANTGSQIDRAQVVAQVTRHLENMRLANGNGGMRLHLTPGHLGNVQISVASHQDGVVARIAVETAQIQQVMDDAKAHLRATLEARGLQVQSVEVTVTPHLAQNNQSAFSQQRSHQSDGESLSGRTAYGRGASLAAPVAAPAITRAASLLRAANSRLDCQA